VVARPGPLVSSLDHNKTNQLTSFYAAMTAWGIYLIEFQLLSRSRDSAFKGRRNAVGIPTSSITFIRSLPDPQALNRELIISLE